MRLALASTLTVLLAAPAAHGMPSGPAIVCEVWPEAVACGAGAPDCTTCHTAPPARNAFGAQIEADLALDFERPLPEAVFISALPDVLAGLADSNADRDGVTNRAEMAAGTRPGDPGSTPRTIRCPGPDINPDWTLCAYDPEYAWRKVHVDVCGVSAGYDALLAFRALPDDDARMAAIDEALATCLDSVFWLGRDGALWRLAHSKIRPLKAIKSGVLAGPVPLADYDHDYALFAYASSDDRDARLLLTADFHARLVGETEYREAVYGDERLETDRRAGMITTRWFFVINTMFTPVPRTTAAQAYRAYLGYDISRSEGLFDPRSAQLVDYDDKGVTAPTCAACHRTLDPLTYPFTRYMGIANGSPLDRAGSYNERRMARYGPEEGLRVREVPEAGFLFGQEVADLVEWATVAANSDAFARATVTDYRRLLVGGDPTPADAAEFDQLWRSFGPDHDYRVEAMLRDLVRTEAYGRP